VPGGGCGRIAAPTCLRQGSLINREIAAKIRKFVSGFERPEPDWPVIWLILLGLGAARIGSNSELNNCAVIGLSSRTSCIGRKSAARGCTVRDYRPFLARELRRRVGPAGSCIGITLMAAAAALLATALILRHGRCKCVLRRALQVGARRAGHRRHGLSPAQFPHNTLNILGDSSIPLVAGTRELRLHTGPPSCHLPIAIDAASQHLKADAT
jgi:hypothetical protein